jgi:hypothetical protein
MTNYRYVKSAIVDRHDILETKTGCIVRTGLTQAVAKETTRKLNFGMGFDGWTPEFFLKTIPMPSQA